MAANQYLTSGPLNANALYLLKNDFLQDLGEIIKTTTTNPNTVYSQLTTIKSFKPAIAIVRAIDELILSLQGEGTSGFCITKSGAIVSQYENCGEWTVVKLNKESFFAKVVDSYGTEKPFILKMSTKDNSEKSLPDGIMYALVAYMCFGKDGGVPDGYKAIYQSLMNFANDPSKPDDQRRLAVANLAEEAKQMLLNGQVYTDNEVFPASLLLTPNPLGFDEKIDADEEYGMTDHIQVVSAMKTVGKEVKTIADLADAYSMGRVLSPEEELMVPDIPATYTIPDKIVYALELITKSVRFRNFILRGPAGTGKTEWCKILAHSLHLPYLFFGCSTDTEKMDLTMSIIPAESDESFSVEGIDPAEWLEDAELAYAEITGEVKEDASATDCLMAVIAKAAGKHGSAFKYVESSLVKAFRNGYVCEVQEPTIMSRPGVLASLNSMFDGCKAVTLVNGETVQRHPDSIVVYTTNTSYEGCVSLNQSALSRMVCIDLEDLSDEKIKERLEKNSGYHNTKVIDKMIKVYRSCIEKAAQEAISDGSIDMRAMEDWAFANSITGAGTIYQNGLNMLISKTSNDPALRAEFISCLESQFQPRD